MNTHVVNWDYMLQSTLELLLGDGHLRNPNAHKRTTGNYRLEFTFKAPVLSYITWLKFTVLGSLSTKTFPTPYPKENPTQYWFATKFLEQFSQMQQHWYVWDNEKKA